MYSPRWLFLYPGILLMLAGLAGCFLLLPGGRVFHGIGLDVHTLLYAFVAILLGFSSLLLPLSPKSLPLLRACYRKIHA